MNNALQLMRPLARTRCGGIMHTGRRKGVGVCALALAEDERPARVLRNWLAGLAIGGTCRVACVGDVLGCKWTSWLLVTIVVENKC